MSAEDEVSVKDDLQAENENPIDSASPPVSLSADEALDKLEDFRCPICQNIIINAYRIACGHTFCRHCLNTHRERQNVACGKATCYICDAAVTEMTHNEDRDKEIDALFTLLSTTERLNRARVKAERKEEEENFAKRPREPNNGSQRDENGASSTENESGESTAASGDASYSITLNRNDSETSNESTGEQQRWARSCDPACNGECFREWRGGCGSSPYSQDSGQNDHYEDATSTNRMNMGFWRPPVVIQHTVERIYHTEVQNGFGESGREARESSHPFQPSFSPQQFTQRNEPPFRGSSAPPRFDQANEPSEYQYPQSYHYFPLQYSNAMYYPASYQQNQNHHNVNSNYVPQCNCGCCSPNNPTPYYMGYLQHQQPTMQHSRPIYSSMPSQSPECFAMQMANSCDDGGRSRYGHHFGSSQNATYSRHMQIEDPSQNDHWRNPHDRFHGLGRSERGFEDENDIRQDGLCDFHRAMLEERYSNESMLSSSNPLEMDRVRSYETLRSRSSNSLDRMNSESRLQLNEDFRDNLRINDHPHEDDPVITLRISLPTRETREAAIARRNSLPGIFEMTSFR